jgi:hypothetical protein
MGRTHERTSAKEELNLDWDPTREDREDLSPRGEDQHLSLTKAWEWDPTGEDRKDLSPKSEEQYLSPLTKT